MNQKTFSHKDKVRMERESLILDVAQSILIKKGYQGLTMQGIANATDYSKGTIYQHFGCKEDVITQLVANCGQHLINLIDLAIPNGQTLRHTVVLVSWAYFKNAEINMELTGLLARAKSSEFQSKVNEALQQQLSAIDQGILTRVIGLFVDQPCIPSDKVQTAAFGWWAMMWGVQDVMVNNWELSKLGFDDPREYFFNALHIFLDGLGVPEDDVSQDYKSIITQAGSIYESNKNKEI